MKLKLTALITIIIACFGISTIYVLTQQNIYGGNVSPNKEFWKISDNNLSPRSSEWGLDMNEKDITNVGSVSSTGIIANSITSTVIHADYFKGGSITSTFPNLLTYNLTISSTPQPAFTIKENTISANLQCSESSGYCYFGTITDHLMGFKVKNIPMLRIFSNGSATLPKGTSYGTSAYNDLEVYRDLNGSVTPGVVSIGIAVATSSTGLNPAYTFMYNGTANPSESVGVFGYDISENKFVFSSSTSKSVETNRLTTIDRNGNIEAKGFYNINSSNDSFNFGTMGQTGYSYLNVSGKQMMYIDGSGSIQFNNLGEDVDTKIYGNSSTPAIFVEGSSSNVAIGTSTIISKLTNWGNAILAGVGRYLNFGSTDGESGYGIRDNAGVMEYKNSGGSWATIGGDSTFYNVTICSTGCSYTSIVTAFNTEGGNKSYFIKNGTYNETLDIIIPSSSIIHWDNVIVSLAANKSFIYGADTDYTIMDGYVDIQGNIASGLVSVAADATYNDASRLLMRVNNTPTVSSTDNGTDVALEGHDNKWNIKIQDETRSSIGGTGANYSFVTLWSASAYSNWIKVDISGSKCSVASTACYGFSLYQTNNNIIEVRNLDVTTDTGNTGKGLSLNDCDYNSITGVLRGADGANYEDTGGGVGNAIGSLAKS